jgi:hypothetical protein
VAAALRFLASKLALNALNSRNSLLNSLIAGNLHGDGCDQHCAASQYLGSKIRRFSDYQIFHSEQSRANRPLPLSDLPAGK